MEATRIMDKPAASSSASLESKTATTTTMDEKAFAMSDAPLPFLSPHAAAILSLSSKTSTQATTTRVGDEKTKSRNDEQYERDLINDNHRLAPLFGCWHASYLLNNGFTPSIQLGISSKD
jgi:hypothetical protein